MIKKIITTISIIAFFATNSVLAAQPKSIGKFKNWETFTYNDASGKICFAQTIPLERAPKNLKRDPSRLFVTFRKSGKIKNEISITSGHEYKISSVVARSGKNEFNMFTVQAGDKEQGNRGENADLGKRFCPQRPAWTVL